MCVKVYERSDEQGGGGGVIKAFCEVAELCSPFVARELQPEFPWQKVELYSNCKD